MKYICMIALTSILPLVGAKPEPVSQLNQLFYHDAPQGAIELGKVVFYFSKDASLEKPEIVEKVVHGVKTVEFRFVAQAHKDVLATAHKLFDKIDKKIARVDLSINKGNRPSMVLRITYNPDIVGYKSELFDAIKQEKGFMCTLLNKPLLKQLSDTTPILRTVCHEKKHGVLIDIGHGGDDHGALSLQAMPEKDITLGIGLKLCSLLRSQGFEVVCTRSDDRFVALDRRTSLYNHCDTADILVSIHANSGLRTACGIETFCCKPPCNKMVSDVSQEQQQSYTNALLSRYDQSFSLAQLIQSSLVDQAKKKQQTVVNRGVKQAASQMLIGVTKPAVLAEVGFVTHPVESSLLTSNEYQQVIARGLLNGICAYFKQTKIV